MRENRGSLKDQMAVPLKAFIFFTVFYPHLFTRTNKGLKGKGRKTTQLKKQSAKASMAQLALILLSPLFIRSFKSTAESAKAKEAPEQNKKQEYRNSD